MKRLLGRFTGDSPGPLVLVFGGIHGNEPAGVRALSFVLQLLQSKADQQPDFHFRGRLVGLIGNRRALTAGRRFIEKDLNRQWSVERVEELRRRTRSELRAEDRELLQLANSVDKEIANYRPERLYVLDVHTTTAEGGIFSIASDDPESIQLGVQLHAPVIKGLLKGVQGTTLHYFRDEHFPCRTVAVSFEAGQHDDPLSTGRAVAAILNLLRSVGCVRAEDVENMFDELLVNYSRGLPRVVELMLAYPVKPEDNFRMLPGFVNFQHIQHGELLAFDRQGPIRAAYDGRLLMPLYQKQGDEGFFLVREVDG